MGAHSITPPIVIDDDGDLEIFASIRDACRYMKPTDVQDDVYDVFDGAGYELTAVVRQGRRVDGAVPASFSAVGRGSSRSHASAATVTESLETSIVSGGTERRTMLGRVPGRRQATAFNESV